jgi:hypothetical protein
LLSFATWLPEQHVRAQFYGVIQVLENVGYLVAAPTLQGVWASALVLPEQWLMLPFIVAAVRLAHKRAEYGSTDRDSGDICRSPYFSLLLACTS